MAEPVYKLIGYDSTGAAMCRYFCAYCGLPFYHRRPCEIHMGCVADHPHNCPKLREEDEARRAKIRAAIKLGR